jgi:hypothetical protein
MKEPLRGKTFTDADDLQGAVRQWCRTTLKDWFQEAIMKPPQDGVDAQNCRQTTSTIPETATFPLCVVVF